MRRRRRARGAPSGVAPEQLDRRPVGERSRTAIATGGGSARGARSQQALADLRLAHDDDPALTAAPHHHAPSAYSAPPGADRAAGEPDDEMVQLRGRSLDHELGQLGAVEQSDGPHAHRELAGRRAVVDHGRAPSAGREHGTGALAGRSEANSTRHPMGQTPTHRERTADRGRCTLLFMSKLPIHSGGAAYNRAIDASAVLEIRTYPNGQVNQAV